MIYNYLSNKKTVNPRRLNGFAIPTVLIASIMMLAVLVVAISSIVAVRVALKDQYYNQLAKTASDAGIAYAEACLAINNDEPLWTDNNPLAPNTNCSGTQLVDCSSGNNLTTNGLCSVTFSNTTNGKVLSSFTVKRPALDSTNNKAIDVTANGTTNLLRSSNNSYWRTYNQSSRLSSISGKYTWTVPGSYTWTIPAGVTSVLLEAWGAQASGLGGYAKGTKAVTPGQALYINVGVGGGAGGAGNGGQANGNGGAGGGASDVRYGGSTITPTDYRIIVAGGGGGKGGDFSYHDQYEDFDGYGGIGGYGGGTSGSDGDSVAGYANGGAGGSQVSGNAKGSGGAGGNSTDLYYGNAGGGGGGGGYYGGVGGEAAPTGSGREAAGGGGGSSYITGLTSPTAITANEHYGGAKVTITTTVGGVEPKRIHY